MAKEIDISPIIDALAAGSLTAEQAVSQMIDVGMSEDKAQYNARSMETVDVV